MTTTADTYKTAASQAREVTDRSVEAWKRTAQTVVDQATAITKLPTIDMIQPVERYFEFVQKSVDLNRDLATKLAELVTNMTGAVRNQVGKVSSVVVEQADAVAGVVTEQAVKAEHFVAEQAEQAEHFVAEQAEQADRISQDIAEQAEKVEQELAAEVEQAEKEQARQARAAERAEAKAAHAKAREPYENLTKTELADQLAERGLAKSGNVDELVERLVSADSE